MLESLLEALKLSPNNIPLKFQVAKLYLQNTQYTEAEKHLLDTINLDSSHLEAKFELANCFYKQDKISASEILLEEIIEKDTQVRFLELLCYCQLKQKNFNDAQQTYIDIIAIDPSFTNDDFDQKLKISTAHVDDDFVDEDGILIYAPFESFGAIQKELENREIEILSSGFERIPQVTKQLNEEQVADVEKLLEKIEEDDDVQNVYHTMQL